MPLRFFSPNLYRPASFQGHGIQRGPYFEGWYFKLVDRTGAFRYAVIPGVFLGVEPVASHAFIQTLDGSTGRTTYHRYPLAAFAVHPREFLVRVGPSEFTRDHLALRIETPDRSMVGTLRFAGVEGWPVRWHAPGIMGWYAFVPFMECYHGVIGFDHAIEGMLAIDGQAVDFSGGRGYIEKDWGQAFPRAWIWMQSNHFSTFGTCLTASVARIPWLGTAFRGFIIGLRHEGRLYSFATYTGATIERLAVTRHSVEWTVVGPVAVNQARRTMRLEIRAHRREEQTDLLHAPVRTAMLQRVLESLTGTIEVRLQDVATGSTHMAETGIHAGLELGGEVEEIL
jgi:tocopherol cyclase